MGLCSSKNAIAPQKPLKTLEQLEQEGAGTVSFINNIGRLIEISFSTFPNIYVVESGKPTAFVIPADDEMLVSTKKPEDLEAEKEASRSSINHITSHHIIHIKSQL